jgi:uncharacterized caspase-like protein
VFDLVSDSFEQEALDDDDVARVVVEASGVSSRKALLIGAEQYGEGFPDLPAVQQDVKLMASALTACGYAVEYCEPDHVSDAGKLDARIRDFCSTGGPSDIRLIYFSGHGLLVENVDAIIPAGTSRSDARVSPNQRVSTDLSLTVRTSKTGLVLFIIDACRNEDDFPAIKGDDGWGNPNRLSDPDEVRFLRYFGCAANQVCQVLPASPEGPASSLFTRAIAESLVGGDCVSLTDLETRTAQRCAELRAESSILHRRRQD